MMLIGAHAQVLDSTNKSTIGLNGTVSLDTKNMLVINTQKGTRMIPKLHCTWSINGVATAGNAIQGRFYERLAKK